MNLNDVKSKIDALCQEFIRKQKELEEFWSEEMNKLSDEIIDNDVDKYEAGRIIVEACMKMTTEKSNANS